MEHRALPPSLYRAVFSACYDGLLLLDREGRVADVNPAFESLAGWPRGELLGLPFLDIALAAEDDNARHAQALAGVIAAARPVRDWPATIKAKDGRSHEVSLSYSPIEAGEGRGLLVVRPIAAAKPRGRLSAELISALGHELRTPLTSIKGSAGMLLHHREAIDEARVAAFLRMIDEQADRLRELVDNLTDLSKFEAGALRLRRRPVPVAALLERVVAAANAHGRQIGLRRLPDDLPAVDVDARRMEQALRALVETLATAGDRPDGIAVGAAALGSEVLLTFKSAAAAPGERGAGHEEAGGAGRRHAFHWALCHGIVAAHEGRLSVERSQDGGSIVHVALPAAAQQALPAVFSGVAG